MLLINYGVLKQNVFFNCSQKSLHSNKTLKFGLLLRRGRISEQERQKNIEINNVFIRPLYSLYQCMDTEVDGVFFLRIGALCPPSFPRL